MLRPGYYYYYQPSIADRALEPNIQLNQTEKGPKANGINVTDADVFAFMQDVKQAWRQRSQAARVGGALGSVSTIGLAAGATTAAATHGGTAAGNTVPILTGIATFIGEVFGLLNPSGRDEAYKDGLKLLLDAEAEYCQNVLNQAENCKVDGTKMTQAGATLLLRTNAAIVVVDKALEGRVPTKDQLDAATARILDTYLKVDKFELVVSPGTTDKKPITVVHGDPARATSQNTDIATVQERTGSNGTQFDVTVNNKATACTWTTIEFSNSAGSRQTVPVRVENPAEATFAIVEPTKIDVPAGKSTDPKNLTVEGCAIERVVSDNPTIATAKYESGKLSVTGVTVGETAARLENKTGRTQRIMIEVK